jgi:hypothetical protein
MINFSSIKAITAPEGKIQSISINGVVVWNSKPPIAEVILVSISAVYSGGNVAIGTNINDLTDIIVTATYSDGTTSEVTGYTLNGTIAEGSNTITVSYNGKTTTFTVIGEEEGLPSIYQEVEWIRANANVGAYLNLGFSFDEKADIYLTQYVYDLNTDTYVFGSTNSNGSIRNCLTSPYATAGGG